MALGRAQTIATEKRRKKGQRAIGSEQGEDHGHEDTEGSKRRQALLKPKSLNHLSCDDLQSVKCVGILRLLVFATSSH